MTWDELKEKAKEMGYRDNGNVFQSLEKGKYLFFEEGNVFFCDTNSLPICFAFNKTPEQMLMIMRGVE